MKVVLYLRMSTDRQDTSIGQQRTALERHAKRAGYEIVREYRDEGISGDATHKRRAFQRMIADAQAGEFDRIVCWDQSRFGRFDSIEAGSWIAPLRDAGVSLETLDGGVTDWSDSTGRITFTVQAEAKHGFLVDLARTALRGQVTKAAAADGMYGASASYGYRRETIIENRRRMTRLVPHEFEAEVVRRIFETYTGTGGTLLAVGEMLNREKIPAPRGAPWHRNAVRRILRNRTYVGDYVWGKTSSGKYFTRAGEEIVPRRRARRTMANDPIVHEGILPALVSRELFDEAQRLLEQRRRATRRPSSVKPLSGLLTCAKCGSPYHVNFRDYRCGRSVDFGDGSRCPGLVARGEPLLQAIAEQLQKHILAPKRLAILKTKLTRAARAMEQAAGRGDTAGLDRQIVELDRQITEGISRIPLVPKSLVPELAKGLEAKRVERDMLKRRRTAMGKKEKSGPAMPERIAEAIAAAYRLPQVLAEGNPAAVNEGLRRLGVRAYIDDGRARVVIDFRDPENREKHGKNASETCNAPIIVGFKSPHPLVIEFEVPVTSERPRKTRGKAG
jgi:DNA invertase Pin-like site-specific DNA recombinase